MPESPCVDCGKLCLHTDDDEEPRCDDCAHYIAMRDLILDVAWGRIDVPDDFDPEEGRH